MWTCIFSFVLWMSAADIQATAISSAADTEFYLLTVGIGDHIDARYGHTILRVEEPGEEVHNYNWGTFSFNEPYFALRFFLGKLRYWVEPWSDGLVDWKYHDEARYVIRDRLQLTSWQKTQLLEAIQINLQGENKYFYYDFFLKNCSTIPRDHLNTILHNQIFTRFSTSHTSMRYRDYVRKYLNTPFGVDTFLEIAMNSTIDFPLSPWEEMFFPLKLREYLLQMPAVDDAGKPIPGKMLLTDTRPWIEAPERPISYVDLYWVIFAWLGLFVLYLGRKFQQGQSPIGVMGAFLLPWSLFSGLLGTVMALAWMFSEHIVLQHNANLWFFWPLDLGLLYPAWRWCRARALPPLWSQWVVALLGGHCACALLAGGLRMGGWIHQDIDKIFGFLLIPLLGIYAIALHHARKQPFLAGTPKS